MKLGVYSCMAPDVPAEPLAELLENIGFSSVEWTIGYDNAVWDRASQWHIRADRLDEEVPRFRALAERHHLQTIGLGSRVSIHNNEELRRTLRAAAELGCSYVRVVTNGYNGSRPYDELLAEVRAALPNLVRLSSEIGVKPLLEIHMGTILPSASAALRVVEGFNPQYLGLIHDAGNMIHEGFENWRMGLEMLGPFVSLVHVKNYGWQRTETGWRPEAMALGDGIVDYRQIIEGLRHIGYDGALSLEDFRGGYGCVPVGITTEEKLREDYAFMTNLL